MLFSTFRKSANVFSHLLFQDFPAMSVRQIGIKDMILLYLRYQR